MFIGLDIGTSSVKAILLGEDQSLIASATADLSASGPGSAARILGSSTTIPAEAATDRRNATVSANRGSITSSAVMASARLRSVVSA